jgi:hypothetical protein
MTENKSHVKGTKWIAQFSMGQMDYIRLDEILKTLNNTSVEILMHDVKAIIPFSSQLRTFYANLKPLMSKDDIKKYDNNFQKLRKFINSGFIKGGFQRTASDEGETITIPEQFFEDLFTLYEELLQIKQEIGLGTEMKRLRSPEDKIRSGLQ